MKNTSANKNRSTILTGILAITLVLVILQLWLLMATMNAFLANDLSFMWPAAGASFACFLLIAGLISYNK